MPGDEIIAVDAPRLAGLSFRRFRGAADFPRMAAVIAASAEADRLESTASAEGIADAFTHLVNSDPQRDMIFAEVCGEVVGYARALWWDEYEGTRLYSSLGFVAPAWRRKGVGRAMLRWAEGRLREIAAAHPAGLTKLFGAAASQHQTGLSVMLEREGYEPVRYAYEMLRPTLDDIADSPLPAGLEVREVLPEHYRAVWEVDAEVGRDAWGSIPPTEEAYQAWLGNERLFQPHLWQVAWDISAGEIAGQVLAFINHTENEKYERRRGYTEFVSVRRPWRRRGLARALIARSLRRQKAEGMTESALSVDSENPSGATRLYEACGFRVLRRDVFYRKPL